MSYTQRVADFVVPSSATVCPTDSLARIRQLMESRDLRSIVVADGNKPVGVIRWSDLRQPARSAGVATARDVMRMDYPTLRADAPASAARERLNEFNLDWLPVVDSGGNMVGVVKREMVMRVPESNNVPERHDRPAGRPRRRAFNIRPRMSVYASDGTRLGLVDRLFLDGGTVSSLLVTYGRRGGQYTQLPFDLVDHLEDETVILGIDQADFSHLINSDS